jgi:citrate synthase
MERPARPRPPARQVLASSGATGTGAAYVGAREAIALLDVRLPTLYAYVSRGLVRSVPGPSRRGRLYARADLEQLKARHDARAGHGAVAADALRWGQPVLDSAITRIDPDGPTYRGHSAKALAEADVPFEAVADLLWRGGALEKPSRWAADGFGYEPERLRSMLRVEGPPVGPFRRLMFALLLLAAADPDGSRSLGDEEECARARTLLVRLPAALCIEDEARSAAVLAAPSMARGVAIALGAPDTAEAARVINRCLIVCADHELNASTFGVRVAASTGCEVYACLVAALAILSGHRHGGAPASLDVLLRGLESPSEAVALVERRGRAGDALPGFGHRLYPVGDARADVLLDAARPHATGNRELGILFAVIDAMRDAGREMPNLDTGLVAVIRYLELPAEAAGALFAIGRIAGWIAHILEQRSSGYLLRPRARYVGPP